VGRGALSRARSVAINFARDGVCMAYVVVLCRRSSSYSRRRTRVVASVTSILRWRNSEIATGEAEPGRSSLLIASQGF
jgi:hypothetical protein